jgi:hypothetical protein
MVLGICAVKMPLISPEHQHGLHFRPVCAARCSKSLAEVKDRQLDPAGL